MALQRPSAAGIEAGHELTASGAGGGQVLVSLGQAFAELLVLLGKAGHLLLELADVIGLSETGLAPDLLAESIGEAVLKLADADCQAGGALVGGNGLQRDKLDGDMPIEVRSPGQTLKRCQAGQDPDRLQVAECLINQCIAIRLSQW